MISVPRAASNTTSERPVRVNAPANPSEARTVKEFFKLAKAQDPTRYYEVLKKYPVNQHIDRDEKAHELEADLSDGASDESTAASVGRQIDKRVYRDWMNQQWS